MLPVAVILRASLNLMISAANPLCTNFSGTRKQILPDFIGIDYLIPIPSRPEYRVIYLDSRYFELCMSKGPAGNNLDF